MIKYEYLQKRLDFFSDDTEKILIDFGKKGWELVSTISLNYMVHVGAPDQQTLAIYIFKRPIEEKTLLNG